MNRSEPFRETNPNRLTRLAVWLALGVFSYIVLSDFYAGGVLMNNPPSWQSKRFTVFMVSLPILIGLYLYGLWVAWSGRRPERLLGAIAALRSAVPIVFRVVLAAISLAIPGLLFLYSPVGNWPLGYPTRIASVLLAAFLASGVLQTRRPGWLLRYVALVVVAGAVFTAFGWLNRVTAYPFSLSWSEGNRIYDYSILYGKGRYLLPENTPVGSLTSRGRQILWALPFLLPTSGIWLMRLWDALLWILPPIGLGYALVGGRLQSRWIEALFALWMFLFMAQGPIYAPLVVCAILVVLAVRSRSLALGLFLVFIAGYYAQISRWTWAYAPGLWAGMLALLQLERPTLRRSDWKRLIRPVAFGLAGYLGGQFLGRLVNWAAGGFQGAPKVSALADAGAAIAYQPLLWDRLLPNATYGPGILLGVFWAGLPLAVLLIFLWRRGLWRINGLQALAAGLISLAFLVVGVIISVKIGGGSNLHNLDMYWLTVGLLAGLALVDLLRVVPTIARMRINPLVIFLALTMLGPVTYNVVYGSPLGLPSSYKVQEALSTIQKRVEVAKGQGEILFIDQRQLLAYHLVPQVQLIPEYEKKVLMDKAMAANGSYLEKFEQDLARHRFALIITEPIRASYITSDDRVFAEENNAWVQWVSEPLLTYYQAVDTFQEVGVQIMVPKP